MRVGENTKNSKADQDAPNTMHGKPTTTCKGTGTNCDKKLLSQDTGNCSAPGLPVPQ